MFNLNGGKCFDFFPGSKDRFYFLYAKPKITKVKKIKV